MPRASDGTYTLPAGNPVVSGTTIQSSWANSTLSDIASALTDSLDRQGRGGMLAPFQFADGVVTAPSITWTNEPNTGIYRAGAGDMRVAIQATDNFRWTSSGADIWTGSTWAPVLYEGGPAGGMPPGTAAYQSIAWDNVGSAWIPNSAFTINYSVGDIANTRDADVGRNLTVGGTLGVTGITTLNDALTVTGAAGFSNGITVTGNIGVTGTVDGVDVSNLNSSYNAHVANTSIHFADAEADGKQYARQNNAWTVVAPTGEQVPTGTTDGNTLAWDVTTAGWINKTSLLLLDNGNTRVAAQLELTNSSTRLRVSSGAMAFDTNNSEAMRLTSDGRMGIGTTGPNVSSKLDVNGAIYTENAPLLNSTTGTALKRLEVRDQLPGTPDPNTLYFLTT